MSARLQALCVTLRPKATLGIGLVSSQWIPRVAEAGGCPPGPEQSVKSAADADFPAVVVSPQAAAAEVSDGGSRRIGNSSSDSISYDMGSLSVAWVRRG